MKRPTLIRVLAMLALVAVMSSCAQVRGDRQTQGVPTEPAPVALAEVDEGPQGQLVSTVSEEDAVFDFTSIELYGRSAVEGMELVQNVPMIMTFVVPSCSVCVLEGPEIAASAQSNPDITYVIVHGAGSVPDYEAYNGATGLYFENIVHLDDSSGALWRRFGVTQQPTTLLVGADGSISQSIGALELDGLKKAVEIVQYDS